MCVSGEARGLLWWFTIISHPATVIGPMDRWWHCRADVSERRKKKKQVLLIKSSTSLYFKGRQDSCCSMFSVGGHTAKRDGEGEETFIYSAFEKEKRRKEKKKRAWGRERERERSLMLQLWSVCMVASDKDLICGRMGAHTSDGARPTDTALYMVVRYHQRTKCY